MFAANTQLELLFLVSAGLDAQLYELAHASLVDALEWVTRQDSTLYIVREKIPGVISGEPHGCLGQVIGAKAKKVSVFSHFSGGEASPGQLKHGADGDINPD